MSTPVGRRPGPGEAAVPAVPGARAAPEDAESPASASPTAQAVPAQSVREIVPPERRGRTDIPGRVVSRIAARSAGEVARVREVGERGPRTFHGGTRATVDGRLTTLRLDVTVEYPAPIRQVTREVRRHVAERVRALTGLDVGHIDIEVVDVVPSRDASRPWDTAPMPVVPAGPAGPPGSAGLGGPAGATAYREPGTRLTGGATAYREEPG